MRVVFLGTSDFARPALASLADAHEISLVITQPDRPAGRHADLRAPAVKQLAEHLGLTIAQPESIDEAEAVARIRAASPDVIAVAAYGQLLRAPVFTAAPFGAVNIHASLLPAYRGAAPAQWSLIQGESTTGVTTFVIDRGMDTGDILLQRSLEIAPNETAGELLLRLAALGAEAIVETFDRLETGKITAIPQPSEGSSLAPRLSRDAGRVDWTRPAVAVHNLARGTTPWPGAWTLLGADRIKIHRTAPTGIGRGAASPGAIALRETGRMLVACADDLIEILEIQRQGRRRTTGQGFLNGLRSDATFS